MSQSAVGEVRVFEVKIMQLIEVTQMREAGVADIRPAEA